MPKDQPAKTAPPAAAQAPPAAEKPALIGRLLTPLKSLAQKPVRAILIGLPVAIIGGLAVWYLLFSGTGKEQATLQRALQMLAAGELPEARRMAAELRTGTDQSFTTTGGAYFVLGSVMAADAKRHENPHERKTLHLIASRYLEESRIRGFPPEHEKEGLLLLGLSLHHGGRFQASIPILKEALPLNPSVKGELLFLLADSHLHLNPPNLEQAATYARRLLAEKHLPQGERDTGLLLQGKIALAQGKFAEGRQALELIPKNSNLHVPAVILSVRLQCEESRAASTRDKAALEKSLAVLAALPKQNRIAAETQGQAELLTAICLELLDKPREANEQYTLVRKSRYGSPEAIAAGFLEADSRLRANEVDQAVVLYKRSLTAAGSAESYHNDWLPLSSAQSRLQAALTTLLEVGDFKRAEELARSLPPLLPEEMAYQWRAKLEHEWGTHLLAENGKKQSPGAEKSQSEAREHFRKAGAHEERLAELRIATRSYLDDLTNSSRDYLAGQGYSSAIRVLRKLLAEDSQNSKQEATVRLAEALLAVGQTTEAIEFLESYLNLSPKHPATYRARYLASLGYEELGKPDQARKHLTDNLYNYSLTPDSTDWRDSIFLLGSLIFHQAQAYEAKSRQLGIDQANIELKKRGLKELERAAVLFQEAAQILDEAVERYPAASQAVEARYQLAEAHRQAARWPRKQLDVTAIEAAKGVLIRDMQAELAAALKEYTSLIEQLSDERSGALAGEAERKLLRNSYFARADVLFDQGKLEDALAAYSAATSRYQHEPEALEAYVQIAACYRRLGRMAEARGTLEQARVVLARMKPDASFTKTTPYSREEWDRLLTWLSAL